VTIFIGELEDSNDTAEQYIKNRGLTPSEILYIEIVISGSLYSDGCSGLGIYSNRNEYMGWIYVTE
jgi:hypothetical protein